jgi:hypothetical protein
LTVNNSKLLGEFNDLSVNEIFCVVEINTEYGLAFVISPVNVK